MNKKNLVIASLISINTFAFAGGDIMIPDINMNIEEPLGAENSMLENVYVGVGYAYTTADADDKEEGNSYILNAGYNFNEYLAIEARYLKTFGDMDVSGKGDRKRKVISKGIYLKPQYPILDTFNIYGLLGYGQTTARKSTDSGFQWGAGANYLVDDNVALFIDYINLYDDTLEDIVNVQNQNIDSTIDAVSVGINYIF